jgi:hypothetical protein
MATASVGSLTSEEYLSLSLKRFDIACACLALLPCLCAVGALIGADVEGDEIDLNDRYLDVASLYHSCNSPPEYRALMTHTATAFPLPETTYTPMDLSVFRSVVRILAYCIVSGIMRASGGRASISLSSEVGPGIAPPGRLMISLIASNTHSPGRFVGWNAASFSSRLGKKGVVGHVFKQSRINL